MAAAKVFFVHLRRPQNARANPYERRDDPFYEFGSFGCTGCHSRNLLHPRHAEELEGARLAFVQGGRQGFRLVYLTPPVTVTDWDHRCEARWAPAEMPFKYGKAPILASNDGSSDFPLVKQLAHLTGRSTLEGGLSSRLRTRATPLPEKMAAEVVAVYVRLRATALPEAIAKTYDEALPFPPPHPDRNRKTTYNRLLRSLGGVPGCHERHRRTLAGEPHRRTRNRCAGAGCPPARGKKACD